MTVLDLIDARNRYIPATFAKRRDLPSGAFDEARMVNRSGPFT